MDKLRSISIAIGTHMRYILLLCLLLVASCSSEENRRIKPTHYNYGVGDVIQGYETSITVIHTVPPNDAWSGPVYRCLVKRGADEGVIRDLLELDIDDVVEQGTLNGQRVVPRTLKNIESRLKERNKK